MKTVTIEIDDAYADVITFTVIGSTFRSVKVNGGGAYEIEDGMILHQYEDNMFRKKGAEG